MAGTVYDKAIGERLRRLREAQGLSGDELAARVPDEPVTPSQISKLERGGQQFTARWLHRLRHALRCRLIDLLEDDPDGAADYGLAGRISDLGEQEREALSQIIETMTRRLPAKPRRPRP
jgi:transcriptional regulator with XRE-family HTH domain